MRFLTILFYSFLGKFNQEELTLLSISEQFHLFSMKKEKQLESFIHSYLWAFQGFHHPSSINVYPYGYHSPGATLHCKVQVIFLNSCSHHKLWRIQYLPESSIFSLYQILIFQSLLIKIIRCPKKSVTNPPTQPPTHPSRNCKLFLE